MKKTVILSMSLLLFGGLLFFNLQQTSIKDNAAISGISSLELELAPNYAEASGDCASYLGWCNPFGCEIVSYFGADWYWQYNGCAPSCQMGGSLCCFEMNYTGCT